MREVGCTSGIMMKRNISPLPKTNIQPTLKKLELTKTTTTTTKPAIEIGDNLPRTKPNVVIFKDALSFLNKLQSPHQKELWKLHWATSQPRQTLPSGGFQHTAESKKMNMQSC